MVSIGAERRENRRREKKGGGLFWLFGEQKSDEVVEILQRNDFRKIVGHERRFGFAAALHLFFGDGNLFAGLLGENQQLAFFAAEQAALNVAIFHREQRGAESAIHIAARVEDVLHDAVRAAAAEAVKLRPDQ